jgi:probable F420-dependent oxidoreductase
MKFDLMVGALSWPDSAALAQSLEDNGFGGMLFTETGQTPWMSIAAAATQAKALDFSTGIAVAFPRSPMISAQLAWELAANTQGRFRLGLGSQVKGHVVRRYSAQFDKPAPQMRDYVGAFQASIRAFRGEEALSHEGPYYNLSYLPKAWTPPRHDFEDIKIDISAVGPYMCRLAGELCDGVHVHPMHSMNYIEKRLLPEISRGAATANRRVSDIDLIIPVFAVAGDTVEERQAMLKRARAQVSFYGSTPNYAFQFDDLGFEGMTQKLGERMKAGDMQGMAELINDDVLEHFAVVAKWDDMADALRERYGQVAKRVVTYLTAEDLTKNPDNIGRWGAIAKALA